MVAAPTTRTRPPPGLPPPAIRTTSASSSSPSTSARISSRPTTPGAEGIALDRFAEIYVPAWLREVNKMVPHRIIRQGAPGINYDAFADGLFPRDFLHASKVREKENILRIANGMPVIDMPSLQTSTSSARIVPQKPVGKGGRTKPETPLSKLQGLPPSSPITYARRSIPIQQTELNARALQLQKADLYEVPLEMGPSIGPPGRFILKAPSIREGWPPVDLGDILHLRQVFPATRHWQGILFEASIEGIDRAAGAVTIRCDALLAYRDSMVFNIHWRVQERTFIHWRRATELVDYDLNIYLDKLVPPLQHGRTVAAAWLFPDPGDVDEGPQPQMDPSRFPPIDPVLNEEQKRAVESICWGQHRVPFLISGPPGTGKTKTLVEAVLRLLDRYPFTHILVCGASNSSADTLARRLAKFLQPKDLLRLNPPGRPFAEVSGELLSFCHTENDLFALPSVTGLLSKRVIVTTCLDASILLEARCTNEELGRLERHIFTRVHPTVPFHPPPPHFGFLLVDEGGQASEPDVLCPLAVVLSNHATTSRAHVTLCGDAKQLGPRIVSEECRLIDLDVSLLERLSDRPLYRDHPFARKNRRGNPRAQWTLGCPFMDLTKNYRSATPILMLPSTLFYHETLEPYAPQSTQQSPLHYWSKLPTRGFPVLFHGLDGTDEPIDEGASFYNDDEVNYVRDTVVGLVQNARLVRAKDVSVISPFREQVWRIRLALRKVGLGDVDVGNVEALQGAENRVVIISAVRSNPRWLPSDANLNRGLINEPKRWNVAMTRAKELLVVVGNVRTLTADRNWLAFYRFCHRNACYTGMPIIDGSPTGAAEGISRLEERYRASISGDEGAGGGDEAAFDVLVGSMARETLGED